MKSSRRGVALMLTLVVAFFLLVLLGAFIVVNRGNSALTVSGLKRQKAYNACMSGLHYVWGELEVNQAWGAGGFPNGVRTLQFPPASPRLKITIYGDREAPDDLEKNYIEGELVGSSESFQLRFVNNLQNRGVIEDTQLGAVPGRSAKLEVVGLSNGMGLKLQSVLRKKPFVDYSALSSDNMSVELENTPIDVVGWRLRSSDPYINQVRSNSEILGPSAIDHQLLFREPPRGGVAKATGDIKLDGTSVQSDPDFLTQSQTTAKGTFQVGAAEIDVPGLKREDLRFPDESVTIPSGDLTMRSLEKHEWTSRDFEVDTTFPPDGIPDTTVTRWRLQKVQHQAIQHNDRLWVAETSFPLDDSGPLNSASDGFPTPTSSEGFQGVPSQPTELKDVAVLYGDEPEHQIKANLTTGEIALTPGTKFEVQGDLQILHEEGAQQPSLLFGYAMDAEGDSKFSAASVGGSAIEDPESHSAALVSTGSLNIDGIATGFGSIFADRSVLLKAKSGLRAEPDLAVAVHGDSITFAAEDPPEGGTQNSLLDADFEFFRQAMEEAGYDTFENWHDLEDAPRKQAVGSNPDLNIGHRTRRVNQNAAYMWDKLGEELDLGAEPNFNQPPFGSEWSGNLTLEHYVRLREYAKTGNREWLTFPGTSFQSMVSQIDQQLGTYSRWASLMGLPIEDFMATDKPEIADVFFVGLVHAGAGGFRATTNGSSLLIEGSVVSQGVLEVSGGPSVDFVYNRLYLDDVVREFRDDHIKLDQVYFRIN
jgi:hypothetical protein